MRSQVDSDPTNCRKLRDKYSKVKQIGKGSFGLVYLVRAQQSGATFVMKTVSLNGLPPKEQRATMNEVKVLQSLQHKHLVRYVDSFVTCAPEAKLCIVLEWAKGGDLANWIKETKRAGKRFTEAQIVKIICQISSAVSYCHVQLKLLHRTPLA